MKKATRDYSSEQEQRLAKVLGGKVTPNSGGTKFGGGDILTEHFLIEAKTPTKKQSSFSIKEEWLDKMEEQGYEQGKTRQALAFQFEPGGENYFILRDIDFLEYVELVRMCTNKEEE